MDAFLGGIYEPCDMHPGRYTYTEGSTVAEPCYMRMDYSYTAIMPQILQVEDYAMHLIWSGFISFMNLIMDQRKKPITRHSILSAMCVVC